MDLEEILLKDVAELTDEDKGILKENWSDLTEDEQEIYKVANPPADPDLNLDIKPNIKPDLETFSFKSQEELDKAIQDKVDLAVDKIKETLKPVVDKPVEDEVPDFVDPTYKPENWNEAFKTLYPKIEQEIIKKIQKSSLDTKEKMDKINEVFNQELIDIRAANPEIPANGTDEGIKFEIELGQIGAKYKLTTMKDSFDIYQALHKGDKGVTPEQKALADKVSHGAGNTPPPKTTKYEDISGKTMDEMADIALSKLKQTS